jgi:hypothetical protein
MKRMPGAGAALEHPARKEGLLRAGFAFLIV